MSTDMDIAEEGKLRQLARDAADTRGPEDSMEDLLNWNNLTYTMPVTNSVVTARNLKAYKSDQNSYDISSGQQILVTMQSGQQFVDWSNSFLEFDLELNNIGDMTLNSTEDVLGLFWAPPLMTETDAETISYKLTGHGGSVLNLFDRIVVTSRSGVELQRIEDFNRLHALHTTIRKSKLWKRTVGSQIQTPPFDFFFKNLSATHASGDSLKTRNSAITNSAKVHYSIPMECFMGLFDTKQLCPSMIASGLRIEFYLTNFANAITICIPVQTMGVACAPIEDTTVVTNGATPPTFKIKDLQILTDTVTLNDAAIKQLNMTSAQNGLEYVYNGHFTQRYIAVDDAVEIQCSKAVSRALFVSAVHYMPVKPWKEFNMVGRKPYLETTGPLWTQHQWRLGSQYFPHQRIETNTWNDYSKVYYNILYATDTLNKNMQIDYDYKRDVLNSSAPLPVVATFERSNLLRFSGVPINNSRTLSLSGRIDTTEYGNNGQILLFLEYVMLSKAFLNNIVVSV